MTPDSIVDLVQSGRELAADEMRSGRDLKRWVFDE